MEVNYKDRKEGREEERDGKEI